MDGPSLPAPQVALLLAHLTSDPRQAVRLGILRDLLLLVSHAPLHNAPYTVHHFTKHSPFTMAAPCNMPHNLPVHQAAPDTAHLWTKGNVSCMVEFALTMEDPSTLAKRSVLSGVWCFNGVWCVVHGVSMVHCVR